MRSRSGLTEGTNTATDPADAEARPSCTRRSSWCVHAGGTASARQPSSSTQLMQNSWPGSTRFEEAALDGLLSGWESHETSASGLDWLRACASASPGS